MISDLYINRIRLNKPQDPAANDSYVFSLPVVRHFGELELTKRVTFFVGENGTGKSTLLEAVAVNYGFNPEGGSRNFNFASMETHSPLHRHITLSKGVAKPRDGFFLRAESFYNVASEVDRLDVQHNYGGVSLHSQSHGESFMSLILNRFWGNGMYILDEPEAALSPSRQFTLIARIAELVKQKSQFIIATHSPILMAYPGAEIYVLAEEGIKLTPYEQTEHYLLTKRFLDNPRRMLQILCEEG